MTAADAPDVATTDGPGRIVVGVDGSSSSQQALRWALDLARATDRPVEALIAWSQPYNGVATVGPVDWRGNAAATLDEVVSLAVDESDAGRVTLRVEHDHPAQALLDAAGPDDMIVVGSRGHGGFAGMLLGSVSQHVVSHARCPVVVVHDPADTEARRHPADAAATRR